MIHEDVLMTQSPVCNILLHSDIICARRCPYLSGKLHQWNMEIILLKRVSDLPTIGVN